MKAHVALPHWRYRMAAHRRMAVQAECFVFDRREKITEQAITLERWRAYEQRYEARVEDLLTDVNRASDAADLRRRIERRTDFVMKDYSVQLCNLCKDRWERLIYLRKSHCPAGPGHSHGLQIGKALLQQLRRRRLQKQSRTHTAKRQRLHRVARAGEIVTVKTD